ncbi:DUF3168 domain-containing protein [Methylobacterium dankookense]|uniref:DUF3168 domain-containing protein n=1 Tax=Methylobacterium dankookense TaxID=560405 RepID=UPI0016436ECD|nr:DUF3168 domain-containing protein [Methylobacterium dankookense]
MARLKADADVTVIVGGRVFDAVPAEAAFPYVSLGEDQVLPDGADCYDGEDVRSTLYLWSRAVGYPEIKRLAAAVEAAIDDDMAVPGYRIVSIAVTDTRFLRDADGLTSRAVLTLQTLIEPAD